MRKQFLSILIIAFASMLNAQIAQYSHPPTVLGQEALSVSQGKAFTPNVKKLIIHDVDEAKQNKFRIKVLEGDNYKVEGKKVVPNANFEGLLHVNIQVNDGKFDSNVFKLKVQVGTPKIDVAKTIFVSPKGDDGNAGTIKDPIRTFQKARELVAEKGANLVYFREGEYYMDEPVVFSKNDSGTPENPIVYTSYENEKVHFTGSKAIPFSAFRKASPAQLKQIKSNAVKNRIRMVNLSELKNFDEIDYGVIDNVGYGVRNNPMPAARLYINGAAMNLARYPNVGNFDDVKTASGQRNFKSDSGVVNKWEQTGEIWIDGPLSKAWEWQKNKIESIDSSGNVTMKWDYHSDILTHDVNMFYFNVFEELDFPEEYFIDKKNNILYVFFPNCVNEDSQIRLTQSKRNFVEIAGASNLVFRNLTFEGTRANAIIFTKESSNNTIDKCTINSCGLDAISINGYSNTVSNSHIHNIGARGINLTGGDANTLTPACNLVYNCKVHDFSQERRAYNPGIFIQGVGQAVSHVELYNGPHMAMTVRGTTQLVEYSDFHNAPGEYSDMLGLYMCTGDSFFNRGVIIRRNKFHDVNGTWKQSAGVYMDNETNGTIVEENYFYNNVAEKSGWSVMVHGGSDNVVRGNVFVDCSFPYVVSNRLNSYARDELEKILKRWQEKTQKQMNSHWLRNYPELVSYFDDGDKKANPDNLVYDIKYDKDGKVANYWNIRIPTSNVFVNNLVFNADPAIYTMGQTDEKKGSYNLEFYFMGSFNGPNGNNQNALKAENNYGVDTNPGFVNPLEYNLIMNRTAPITKKLPHLREPYFKEIGLETKTVGATK